MPKLIATPLWDEIADKYAGRARSDLARLVASRGLDGGRLILWQDAPGTGKTYALARAWRDWCDFHVVVDPSADRLTLQDLLLKRWQRQRDDRS